MRIGQVAKAAQINIETIRFYERKGLIEQPLKMGNMNKMKNHQDMKHKMPNMN